MILTIKEAKEKWCPKYQVSASSDKILTNRNERDYAHRLNCNCIADRCMWWVEEEDWMPIADNDTESIKLEWFKTGKGYCGCINK